MSVGIKFLEIGQAGKAEPLLRITKDCSKELEFKKSSFWMVPSLNPLTYFHESYVKMFYLMWYFSPWTSISMR